MNTVLMSLEIISDFISALDAAGRQGALNWVNPSVEHLVSAANALIQTGNRGAQALQDLTTEIEGMVAAGRDPTEAEFAALKARSDAAHAILQTPLPL